MAYQGTTFEISSNMVINEFPDSIFPVDWFRRRNFEILDCNQSLSCGEKSEVYSIFMTNHSWPIESEIKVVRV